MEKPKCVEASRVLAFEFYQRCAEHKGKPAERVMQEKVLKSVAAHEDWTEASKDSTTRGFIFQDKRPDVTAMSAEEANAAVFAWGTKQREWLDEPIFVELDKKCRAFLWKTFYVPMFAEPITPDEDKRLSEIAKTLGRTGALTDMREDVEEWKDEEEEKEEEK